MSAAAIAYISGVVALAVPVAILGVLEFGTDLPARTFCYLLLSVITAGMKLVLPGMKGAMTSGFFIALISIAELSEPEALLVVAAGAIAQSLWMTRSRPSVSRSVFNLAVMLLATSSAHWVIHELLPPMVVTSSVVRIAAGALVYFALNSLLVAGAISISEDRPILVLMRESSVWAFPFFLVGSCIAAIATAFNKSVGWETTAIGFLVFMVVQRYYGIYLERLQAEKKHVTEIAALHLRTIEALALAIDAKDDVNQDHLQRLQVYSVEIAKEMGLDQLHVEAVRTASLLHDVGKLAVPEHIICKPGQLTAQEFQKMKIHPVVGAEILEQVEFPYPVAPIVRCHHERWDGSGYPDGISGEKIPVGARILAVVDCLDALASERTYRKALPLADAVAQVVSDSGRLFDPHVVEIVERRYREFEAKARLAATGRRARRAPRVGPEPQPAQGVAGIPRTGESSGFITSIAAAGQEAQFVLQVTRDLGNSLSIHETLSVVASRIEQLVPHDSIAIYLRRGDILRAEHVRGEDLRLLSSLEIPVGEGLSGWVAAENKPILNGNPSVEPSYLNDSGAFSLLRSALAVPLFDGESTVGVLTLYRLNRDAFNEDDLRVLMSINTKIATAVANALRFQQVESSATIDSLTGLPNARGLFAALDAEIAKGKVNETPVAVLLCDLDGFKAINDSWGHLEGNRVLQLVAEGFRCTLRESDYVARMGGDEFVFILPGVESRYAEKLIPRLQCVAQQAGREVTGGDVLSVSVGMAVCPTHSSDSEELLTIADRQMYERKAENKSARATSTGLPALRAGSF
jgi:diguanylate cyclase (GGDEF)-like protein/putative nucleotidyltransferase with HDIG domain